MKLFTIGESISQGFMSLAAARTDLSFSRIIARAMDVEDYRIPDWPQGGLPVNLEGLLRRIERLTDDGADLTEWPRLASRIASYLDEVEDYYERGVGAVDRPDPAGHTWYHNVAVRGFSVADAWQVDSELCRKEIRKSRKFLFNDGFFAVPSASFYRTALSVLNPSRDPQFDFFTALDWLDHHHLDSANPHGVENVIVWLGSNNALETVIDLEIKATDAPFSGYHPNLGHVKRRKFNLWSPNHFEQDFTRLLDKIQAIMAQRQSDWHVFLANVPAVTIAPLAKGVGRRKLLDDPFGVLAKAVYFEYYTYVLFDRSFAESSGYALTRDEAYGIDVVIAQYNDAIERLAAERNQQIGVDRFHIVDIAGALLRAAYKRNDGNPSYPFPPEVSGRSPMVDTRYYKTTPAGHLVEGGLFSLDGVHPTAVGQGLIAHEFLQVMNQVRGNGWTVNWDAVYAADNLYNMPLRNIEWLFGFAPVMRFLLSVIGAISGRGGERGGPPTDDPIGPFV